MWVCVRTECVCVHAQAHTRESACEDVCVGVWLCLCGHGHMYVSMCICALVFMAQTTLQDRLRRMIGQHGGSRPGSLMRLKRCLGSAGQATQRPCLMNPEGEL